MLAAFGPLENNKGGIKINELLKSLFEKVRAASDSTQQAASHS